MKIWKKILIGLGIFALIIIILGVVFLLRARQMVKVIDSKVIEDVDLTQIEDSVYAGEFGNFLVNVKLEVTVQDHHITGIKITEQRSSPDHEARETVDRIIEAQSPKVDVVTGATGSSKCIMIAVQKALTGE
ncbi:hypothetical protein AMJ87_07005 [candidate division WOR_3 bacterium SM23_60]|uniref:FMN-binding domain-containing protein n=1 Tax=candidate division WOR_3 bacterium SM23_60 TaxID=1703780 RepID=A0A0S8GGY9_UNCW3|nr:MAG: hypothetical protein AMJ87_07005 [candidate division WOR_3 bacterium SM23_60]